MIKTNLLKLIIFVCGALTMIFEILGSRILGPYFGTSIFVWTSLIGIIMGSLSIGYWLGGKFSDIRNSIAMLAWILFFTGFFMLLTALGDEYLLKRLVKYLPDFRSRLVAATILLFTPAAILMGMVLPFVAKMIMNNVRTSGSVIGNLFALSTTGSIVGTFAAGFVLVPFFGYENVLFSSSSLLLMLTFLVFLFNKKPLPLVISVLMLAGIFVAWLIVSQNTKDYIDTDTSYNRVLIYHSTDNNSGRPVKILKVNDEKSSAMFTDKDDDLVFEVLKFYRLVEHFSPGFNYSLMIGGSGYAFPKDYLRRYSGSGIDVVEIDPGLTALAKLHFGLMENDRLNIYHEDGRTYLNRCQKKYDAVFMDAYKSMLTIPYQLTTAEAVQRIYHILNENGAVYANIISSLNPEENFFLQSEIKTYSSIFPQVFLFAVQFPNPSESEINYFQNFLLVGLKSKKEIELTSENLEINSYLSHSINLNIGNSALILTDEFAPVEFYASKALTKVTRQK